MALNSLKIECTVDELMEKARQLNFTKNGEIFDGTNTLIFLFFSYFVSKTKYNFLVSFLHGLAELYTKTELVNLKNDTDFFQTVLEAKLILIAYDTDANYEPCNKKGIKAHWALITGFLVPISFDEKISKSIIDYTEENKPVGIHFIKSLKKNELNSLKQKFENNQTFRSLIYVICKQGKSKNLGIWSLEKLLDSNRQLKEINSSKCDPFNFVLPLNNDLSKSLSLRVLVFK